MVSMEIRVTERDRLAPKPKKRNTPIIISGLVTLAIAALIGLWFYQENQKQVEQRRVQEQAAVQEHMQAMARSPEPVQAKAPVMAKPAKQLHIERAVKPVDQPGTSKKQTVFNDQNYVPKGAVNSIPPPTMTSRAKPQTRKAPTRYREWAPWYWDSVQSGRGGRKTRTSGRFAYDVIGSRIDTSSVCSNEKAGSLRYRDCRKGAKRFFQENCSRNQMFCLAGEMAP